MVTTMTSFIPSPRSPISEVSRRIGGLLEDQRGPESWWAQLASDLDELARRLMADVDEAWRAMSDQIMRDAPHMTARLRRLDKEGQALLTDLLRVRVLTGEAAGDPDRSVQVKKAIRALLARIRHHEEREILTVYDAYQTDIGGESA